MEYIIIPSVEKRRDSCSNLELFLQLYRWLMSGKPRKSAKIYSEKIVDTITKKIQKISLLEFSSRRQGSGQATPSLKSPDSQVPPVPPTVI